MIADRVAAVRERIARAALGLIERKGLRVAHEEPVRIRKQGRGYAEGEVLLLRKA